MNPVSTFRVPDHADGPLQIAPLPNLNLPINIQRQGPQNGPLEMVPITDLNTTCNYFFVIQVCHALLKFSWYQSLLGQFSFLTQSTCTWPNWIMDTVTEVMISNLVMIFN
jgi:hypothetical protein